MSPFCEQARAIVRALVGSRSTPDAVERASRAIGEQLNADSLRKRLAAHRHCCQTPTIGSFFESKYSPQVRQARDTDPGMSTPPMRAPSSAPRYASGENMGTWLDKMRALYDEAEREMGELNRARFDREPDPEPLPFQPTEPAIHRAPSAPKSTAHSALMARIHAAVKGGPVSFSELCDALDMSPSKARAAVDEARASGMRIDVEHDHVGIRPTVDETRIQEIGVPPVVGERQHVAVISDLHFGSKYCLREQLREFVTYAYGEGVRNVIVPGDLLDGCYKHGLWELSHHGLDEQVDDMFATLPALDGLRYHAITGNHDETFEDTCGIHVGPYIEDRFRSRGRHDVRFYGRRGAWIRIGGAVVDLWHPRGGGSYAKSYKLQKKIEGYAAGQKPHILLVGHWHQYCHLYERGVHGFLCPTFQGGGSSFGKSLGGAPTIGGLIMSWDLTEGGTMRRFAHEYRAYFEAERVVDVNEARP